MFDSLETAAFIMATTDNMDEGVFNSGVGLLSPDKQTELPFWWILLS